MKGKSKKEKGFGIMMFSKQKIAPALRASQRQIGGLWPEHNLKNKPNLSITAGYAESAASHQFIFKNLCPIRLRSGQALWLRG